MSDNIQVSFYAQIPYDITLSLLGEGGAELRLYVLPRQEQKLIDFLDLMRKQPMDIEATLCQRTEVD